MTKIDTEASRYLVVFKRKAPREGPKKEKMVIYDSFRKYGLTMKDFVKRGRVTLVLTTVLVLTACGLVLSIPMTATTSSTGTEQQSVMAQTTNNDTLRIDAGGG
ncbi:MAG: hypothetical protein ACRD8W_30100, partial [Nitrososphaeraceae archaeon]